MKTIKFTKKIAFIICFALVLSVCFLGKSYVFAEEVLIFDENDDLDLAYDVPVNMDDPAGVHHKIGLITDPALAYSNTKSLLVAPDPYAGARLDHKDAAFINVDALEFWIRTTSGTFSELTGGSFNIRLCYDGTRDSKPVSIWPYISDRQITTQYKRVLIPRADLPRQDKPEMLIGTFRKIYFKVLPVPSPAFYVDAIALVDTQGPIIENIEVLDSKHLMLTFNEKVNFDEARNITKYTVCEAANPAATLQINSVGLRVWVTGFDGMPSCPIIKHYVYLSLNQEIQSGKTYKLDTTLADISGNPTRNSGVEFSFNFENEISSSIKINQVGYLPKSPKRVYVGNYLGDAGEMPLIPNLPVYIKDKTTQETVYEGILQKSPESDIFMLNAYHRAFSGEEVWYFDFSGFEAPGAYYAQIPGIGRSYNFEIGNTVFNDVFYKTARALYYQRSGIELDAAHAGIWARPSDDSSLCGYYHNSVEKVGDDISPLYDPAIEPAIGGYIDLSGGWFDAADYNKYIQSAAYAVDYLLTIFEVAPTKFTDNQLNIPESENGVPDILDEAKWELDFIVKMVSANGAVFNKVTHPNFYNASGGMPHQDLRKMWAITKTTRDTALACAILAKAARVLQPYFPEAAQAYKEKALLAWQLLQDHPNMYPNPLLETYTNPAGDPILGIPSISTGQGALNVLDTNERAWAAIELYALTGDEAYHQKFKEIKPLNTLSNWMVEDYWYTPNNIRTGFDYLRIPTADPAMKTQILDGMRRVFRVFDSGESQWRYRVAEKGIGNIGFGTLSMSTRYSFYYILYYYLTGNEYYLDKAKLNLDFQLGANPLSTTFITGVGSKYPLNPQSTRDDYDGIVEPEPGFSVYGPAGSLPYKNYYAAFLENAYPAYYGDYAYPAARKYQDHQAVTKYGEYVIDDLTRTAAVFGYFSDNGSVPPPPPPPPQQFTISVAATNGAVAKNPNKSSYISGESIALTATPNAGYTFSGWSGDLSGNSNPATIIMNSNKTVTVNFTISIIAPVAGFSATPLNGNTPLTVQFSDASTNNPTSYLWNFGDGATSTQKNPSHIYASAGIYAVKLTATNAAGSDIEEKTNYITVTTPPPPPPQQYTITASSGTNGSISPSGATTVNSGSSQSFTITANAHYHIADVLVDSASVGAVESYTFSNVTADHTIAASFAIDTQTLTITAVHGRATKNPDKSIYNYGDRVDVTAMPDAGYRFVKWSGTINYTSNPVQLLMDRDESIIAEFTPITYTITASAGANGSISPSGVTTVNSGADQTYSITANQGYRILDVLVDSVSVGAMPIYRLSNISANHTIVASFKLIPVITIPAAPSNLVTTPMSRSQVQLTWQDNSDNETGFKIEKSKSPTSGFRQIAAVRDNVTSYNDALWTRKTYYYRVRAYNASGDSSYSNTAQVTALRK